MSDTNAMQVEEEAKAIAKAKAASDAAIDEMVAKKRAELEAANQKPNDSQDYVMRDFGFPVKSELQAISTAEVVIEHQEIISAFLASRDFLEKR